MDFQEFISYVIANKEIIIIVLLCGGFATTLIRGAKKVISAVVTVMMLAAALSFFGVPMEKVGDAFQAGVSRFEQTFSWAKEAVPEYIDKANGIIDKVTTASGTGASWQTSEEDSSAHAATSIDGETFIHFIDVGQADCILIQDGEDTMLIDVGNRSDDGVVSEYLAGLGIEQIDYFVATHPHEDHIGCAATILRLFDVDVMLKTEADNTTACYTSMMEQAEKSGVQIDFVSAGDIYTLGDGEVQVIGPISENEDELNNTSIVLRYQYGETSFLFAGDAEREEEAEILEAGFDVDVDVLKLGHHGSSTSTSYPWLRAIMPQYAIAMCGEDNKYGHPHEETLSKLNDAGVTLYRTDLNGTIVFVSDGIELTSHLSAA